MPRFGRDVGTRSNDGRTVESAGNRTSASRLADIVRAPAEQREWGDRIAVKSPILLASTDDGFYRFKDGVDAVSVGLSRISYPNPPLRRLEQAHQRCGERLFAARDALQA